MNRCGDTRQLNIKNSWWIIPVWWLASCDLVYRYGAIDNWPRVVSGHRPVRGADLRLDITDSDVTVRIDNWANFEMTSFEDRSPSQARPWLAASRSAVTSPSASLIGRFVSIDANPKKKNIWKKKEREKGKRRPSRGQGRRRRRGQRSPGVQLHRRPILAPVIKTGKIQHTLNTRFKKKKRKKNN